MAHDPWAMYMCRTTARQAAPPEETEGLLRADGKTGVVACGWPPRKHRIVACGYVFDHETCFMTHASWLYLNTVCPASGVYRLHGFVYLFCANSSRDLPFVTNTPTSTGNGLTPVLTGKRRLWLSTLHPLYIDTLFFTPLFFWETGWTKKNISIALQPA